jgi:hypothetical protein
MLQSTLAAVVLPALDPVRVGHAGFVHSHGSADSAVQPRAPAVLNSISTQALKHHVQSARADLGQEFARRSGSTVSVVLQHGRDVDVLFLAFDRAAPGSVLYAATSGLNADALESSASLLDELRELIVEPSPAPEAAKVPLNYDGRKERLLISVAGSKKMVLDALRQNIGPAIVAADAHCGQPNTAAAGDDLGSPSNSDGDSADDTADGPAVPRCSRTSAAPNAAREAADASRLAQVQTPNPETHSSLRILP